MLLRGDARGVTSSTKLKWGRHCAAYGRQAGKDAQFMYSDAIKAAAVTWDEATLDRWLTDTESVIRGNDMAFRLNDPADRANIIAYLRQLSGK